MGLILGVETLMAAIWGSSFHHSGTGSGHQGLPHHQWVCSSCVFPGPCRQSFRDTAPPISRPHSKPHWRPSPPPQSSGPTATAQGRPHSQPGWMAVSSTSAITGAINQCTQSGYPHHYRRVHAAYIGALIEHIALDQRGVYS